jgi:hypothetical protein
LIFALGVNVFPNYNDFIYFELPDSEAEIFHSVSPTSFMSTPSFLRKPLEVTTKR